ncbi:MAG: hypothetical protein JJU02_07710 [Cryomorphaceae bacterium]|nr:hypothetical protein [Cryomorphaceae bacterium]
MQKILSIEGIKLRGYPIFPILLLVNVFFYVVVAMNFSKWVTIPDQQDFNVDGFGLFNPGFILETLSFLAGIFKYFSVIVLLLYVALDFRYKMHRRQVMEGMSRLESFSGKWMTTAIFVVFHIALIYFLSVVLLTHTNVVLERVNREFWYYPLLWGIEFLVLFSLGFLLVQLTRKSGLSVVLLLLYAFIVEPILGLSIKSLKPFLPISSSRNLVTFPLQDNVQVLLNIEEFIGNFPLQAFLVSLISIAVFVGVSWRLFVKSDL